MKIKWSPAGSFCLKCGGPNPDKGDICGSCDEPANSPKEGPLPLVEHEERKTIFRIIRRFEAQK